MGILGLPRGFGGILGSPAPDLGLAHGNFGIFPRIWGLPQWEFQVPSTEFWEFCSPHSHPSSLTVLTLPLLGTPQISAPLPVPNWFVLVSHAWDCRFFARFSHFRALLAQIPARFRASPAPSASQNPKFSGKNQKSTNRAWNRQKTAAGGGGEEPNTAEFWGKKEPNRDFLGLRQIFFFLSSFNFFGGFGPSLSWSMRNSAITKQRRLGELIFNPFVLIFLLVLSQNHNFLGLFEGVFLGGFLKIASFWGEAKGGRRGGGERPCTPKNRSFSPHSKRWRNYLICK